MLLLIVNFPPYKSKISRCWGDVITHSSIFSAVAVFCNSLYMHRLSSRFIHEGKPIKSCFDIANDAVRGDLANWTAVIFWIDQMKAGRVAALMAGPPCETWSAARTRPLPNVKRQPRPLRSRDLPWGLHYLTMREYDQLDLGNQLLRVTILFLYVAYQVIVPAVMEHPATAEDEKWSPAAGSYPRYST